LGNPAVQCPSLKKHRLPTLQSLQNKIFAVIIRLKNKK